MADTELRPGTRTLADLICRNKLRKAKFIRRSSSQRRRRRASARGCAASRHQSSFGGERETGASLLLSSFHSLTTDRAALLVQEKQDSLATFHICELEMLWHRMH
eukprot:1851297-Pleurochrysis_carterae.AAC.1